jgi:nitrogen regulatory protein PII
MNLIVAVIEDVELIPALMTNLKKNGIGGATVIDSYGMGRILSRASKEISDKEIISYVLSERRPTNRTIFIVVDDEKLEKTIGIFQGVVGDFTAPKTGILFTVKLDKVFK